MVFSPRTFFSTVNQTAASCYNKDMDRAAPFSHTQIEHARRVVVDDGFFWSQVNAAFDEPALRTAIDLVLAVTPDSPAYRALPPTIERGLPGDPRFREGNYYRQMLGRYLAAAASASGRRVLESCCGLGWGAQLLAASAASVVAYDRSNDALAFCKAAWPSRSNLAWHETDALAANAAWCGAFDIVTAMETVEHFSRKDGDRYLATLAGFLKPGGLLLGTTWLSPTREIADGRYQDNPHHLYMWTTGEFTASLRRHFGPDVFMHDYRFGAVKAEANA
jgi:2-polyprenyl-3-methyl-5-hydroxy-6-metoxy-1,4-benzoquinol methylase